METRGTHGGFRRLGATGTRGLGLNASRARTLAVEAAWRAAAGASIARRARVVRIARGILEIRVDEPAWRRAVAALLPEIEAKLAREAPSLGVAAVRLVDAPNG